jgi:hypothetical protein
MPSGRDERTVLRGQSRSEQHCRHVHEHLVEPPRDLRQVQGGILWLALAIPVWTLLWLGG